MKFLVSPALVAIGCVLIATANFEPRDRVFSDYDYEAISTDAPWTHHPDSVFPVAGGVLLLVFAVLVIVGPHIPGRRPGEAPLR